MRRLVICFDGTWNLKVSTTNVWRLYTLLSDCDAQGIQQLKHYVPGVGTRWYDGALGGMSGMGTYSNVRNAYTWLAEVYKPGDELTLFGFSRGALAALSLANLIDRCGILKAQSLTTFEEVDRLYRLPGFVRSSPASSRIRKRAADYNAPPPLRFIGLFDTVAGLFANRFFRESMHILRLPESATRIFHALALDETRRPFHPVRFTAVPENATLHERWFSGSHANVGGGYDFDPLSILPLKWMLEGARQHANLVFPPIELNSDNDVLSVRERDSLLEFFYGIPALAPGLFRLRRELGIQPSGEIEEWIDSSAIERFAMFHTYRADAVSLRKYFEAISLTPPSSGDIRVKKRN